MGYVAVTGGDKAIENATKLNKLFRLSHAEEAIDPQVIQEQMRLLIDRVMGEGGLYAPEYAAIALKQAEGDPAEASFLLRSYRSTLQRNYTSRTLETKNMRVIRHFYWRLPLRRARICVEVNSKIIASVKIKYVIVPTSRKSK